MKIINEPTAAGIAYGLDKKKGAKNVLVFDLGGGTFDVSLLNIDDGVTEVVATNGDTHLGGEDFDQRVMDYFIKLYKKKYGKDVRTDNRAVQKLRREVERAKRSLSFDLKTRLEIENFFDGEDFSETLTRTQFENLNMDLFKSTMKPLQQVLEDAGVKRLKLVDDSENNVDEIVLVGGSTRIPKIQLLVKDYFSWTKPIGGINPDEAVAYGAAVLAGVLSGEPDTGDLYFLDVNPLTMGIETVGGVMSQVVPRNTGIPTKKSKMFTTVEDYQTSITFKIFEGERPMTKDNHLLGKFVLTGIPPALREIPHIEVTFDVDDNGMLQVFAKDTGTGNMEGITITNDRHYISLEDIERMMNDAEKFADDDKEIQEQIESRNEFESYLYSLKAQLADKEKLGGTLSDKDKLIISEAIGKQIEWYEYNHDDEAGEYRKLKKAVADLFESIISKSNVPTFDTLEEIGNLFSSNNEEL